MSHLIRQTNRNANNFLKVRILSLAFRYSILCALMYSWPILAAIIKILVPKKKLLIIAGGQVKHKAIYKLEIDTRKLNAIASL